MPTAGDYEIEVVWHDGNVPDADHQDPIWWENGAVCSVRLDDLEVVIHKDGATRIEDRETGSTYTSSSEFPAEVNGDKALEEVSSGNYPRFYWENNPWFDIYTPDGEHLDMVGHGADEVFESACDYLIEQFTNLCQIENNQIPQIEGKRVVVVDFEDE